MGFSPFVAPHPNSVASVLITKSTSGLLRGLKERGWFPTTNLIPQLPVIIASELPEFFFNDKSSSYPTVLYCSIPISTAGKTEMTEPIIQAKYLMFLILTKILLFFLVGFKIDWSECITKPSLQSKPTVTSLS